MLRKQAVRFPEMRAALISAMRALATPEYQQSAWVRQEFPGNVEYDDFDRVVHFLFDDSSLADDPHSLVGVILFDDREVELVTAVIQLLDSIFDKYGLELSDAEYIALPEWPAVVACADRFMRSLDEHEQ